MVKEKPRREFQHVEEVRRRRGYCTDVDDPPRGCRFTPVGWDGSANGCAYKIGVCGQCGNQNPSWKTHGSAPLETRANQRPPRYRIEFAHTRWGHLQWRRWSSNSVVRFSLRLLANTLNHTCSLCPIYGGDLCRQLVLFERHRWHFEGTIGELFRK